MYIFHMSKKTCNKSGNKVIFNSKEIAETRAKEINMEEESIDMRAYKCEFCKRYHLTSKEDDEFQKMLIAHKKNNRYEKKIKKENRKYIRYDMKRVKEKLNDPDRKILIREISIRQ